MTSDSVLLLHIDESIATVTLHRPERRNALSTELRRALWATMTELDANDDVHSVVLTGADPAFCAGLDLNEVNDPEFFATLTGPDKGAEEIGQRSFPQMSKLVIGAINGAAVTGGLEVALNCDLRIASERASFRDTHAKVGVVPGWGLDTQLPEAVGAGRARQMSATCEPIDAPTALRWGLVNEVLPHESLLARAAEIATQANRYFSPVQRRILRGYRR